MDIDVATDAPSSKKRYTVEQVWTPKLGQKFTAISNYFLANMHRIGPVGAEGLTPTEAMVIIQIIYFKWDHRAPKPALTTIAKRLNLAVRTVRETVRRLEGLGLMRRELNDEGGCSRYHFDGLFARLEQMQQQDAAAVLNAEETA